MNCPQCEIGMLEKVRFSATGKTAYLCDRCGTFWYEDEHKAIGTGHMMDEDQKNSFVFVSEADEEKEGVEDEYEREQYESSK